MCKEALKIGSNCCTNHIKIHPRISAVHYIGMDFDYTQGIHIFFDKRQIWDVYYYRFADCQGWVLKYGIIQVEMSEKDFTHFFGAYEIQ